MGYFYRLCKIKFYWLGLKKQFVLHHISRAAKLWVWLAAKVQPVRRKFQGWGSLTWNVLPNTPIFPDLWGGFELEYYEESCLNQLSVDTLKSWRSRLFFFLNSLPHSNDLPSCRALSLCYVPPCHLCLLPQKKQAMGKYVSLFWLQYSWQLAGDFSKWTVSVTYRVSHHTNA